MYGYNYMKKIILRHADLKEYVIAERDFKYLYPSDFEDLYLLNLQGHLNHLTPEDKKILTTAVNLWTRNLVIRQRVKDFQLGIESYQTQLNLTKPRWDVETDIQEKDEKQSQKNDKTKHGMEKTKSNRSQSLPKDRDADASFHFRNSDKYYHDQEECEYAGPKVTASHEGNIPQQG
ncbi:hypothetical protein Tco_0267416 [Tanacetum coccineum]